MINPLPCCYAFVPFRRGFSENRVNRAPVNLFVISLYIYMYYIYIPIKIAITGGEQFPHFQRHPLKASSHFRPKAAHVFACRLQSCGGPFLCGMRWLGDQHTIASPFVFLAFGKLGYEAPKKELYSTC
jgi:hypothetical protein